VARWSRSDQAWAAWDGALGATGWSNLFDLLADRTSRGSGEAGDVLAALGAGLGRHRRPDQIVSVLRGLPPLAASWVLDRAGLVGRDLADAASDILARWANTDWWIEGSLERRNPADRVLATVAADPEAARLLVTGGEVPFAVLLFGPNDHRTPPALWISASSPEHHDVAEAGAVVRMLLDELRAHPLTATETMVRATFDSSTRPDHAVDPHARWLQARAWIGAVTAPWQPYLAGLADQWGWNPSAGLDALRWVAATPGAARHLADGIGPALALGVTRLAADGPSRRRDIDALGWSVGAIDQVLLTAAATDAVRDRWMWSLFSLAAQRGASAGVSALTAGAPTPLPWIAGTVANRATRALVDELDGDENAARRARELAGLNRRQVAATALVSALVHGHRATGRVEPATPPPPVGARTDHTDPLADDELIRWIEETDLDPDVRAELLAAALSVTGPADRGRVAAG
jgi:hypothetical protein